MAMKNVLKQPEKNAQRDPGEKGWACYYCGITITSRGIALRHLSHLQLQVLSAKDHTGRETDPRGVGFRGQNLKKIRTEGAWGSPHKLLSEFHLRKPGYQ